jgi:hypothetical protein
MRMFKLPLPALPVRKVMKRCTPHEILNAHDPSNGAKRSTSPWAESALKHTDVGARKLQRRKQSKPRRTVRLGYRSVFIGERGAAGFINEHFIETKRRLSEAI